MVDVGAFVGVFGKVERGFETITNLEGLLAEHKIPIGLEAMGCGKFGQSELPCDALLNEAITGSLEAAGLAPDTITYLILATSDNHLNQIDDSFAARILDACKLSRATPLLVSLQKCASSIAALELARTLLSAKGFGSAIVVGFDALGNDDAERIKPFALFGDAAASCIVSVDLPLQFRIEAVGTAVDVAGLNRQDSMESRKIAVLSTIEEVCRAADISIDQIEACFSTNLFKPVAMFNAGISGLPIARLATPTATERGHCGNADWMINLAAFQQDQGLTRGARYLAQAFAPGFCASALLRATVDE